MKLLITGDWHLRQTTPNRRVDDYWKTVQRKINFILDLAVKEKCDLILQPGDFFDSHKANDFLKRYVIKRLKKIGIKIITVFGQHDLRYHSSEVKNTPLAVLNSAEVIYLAEFNPLEFDIKHGEFDWIHIYGASWYEEIPKHILATNPFSILIAHKMVIQNKKMWQGQEDYSLGNILLRTHPFNLMVFGDNHNSFVITKGNRRLINCGSLLRSSIDQINHVPIVYTYDIMDDEFKEFPIPIEPFEQVFDMAKVSAEKERNEKMEAFVDRLTGEAELEGLDFVKNMHSFVEKNKEEIDDTTQEIIGEVMGG